MPLLVRCPKCSHENRFEQPYAYHAGFGNQGFLYNEAGNCTLVWNSYDPAFSALVGPRHPWSLDAEARRAVEEALRPSPKGDRWLFDNPPRCMACGAPIGGSMLRDIYYLVYPGSVDADAGPSKFAAHCCVPPPSH
jgi:hypothetical protein